VRAKEHVSLARLATLVLMASAQSESADRSFRVPLDHSRASVSMQVSATYACSAAPRVNCIESVRRETQRAEPIALSVAPGAKENDGQPALGALSRTQGSPAAPDWTAEGNQPTASFGRSVATAGDVNGDGYSDVIVGAPGYNGHGRVFLYLGSASGLATTPAWTADGTQPGARFGTSVASAGDVNGDGYSDVIVGAPLYDNGLGRVFLYLGSASGLATSPAWSAEGIEGGGWFGSSVASAGDVDGDGYGDIVVGAPFPRTFQNVQGGRGQVFVYRSTRTGLSTTPAWTLQSNQSGSSFGASVASAGDVNGDGYSDVIIGAPGYTRVVAGGATQVEVGRASLYLGSATGLVDSPVWTADGTQPGARFGTSVASAGDVDGDGYSDVIVGARVGGASV